MEGPPLGPGREDITWPDQVAPRGRKASSTRKLKPQTSNPNSPARIGGAQRKPEPKHTHTRRTPQPGVAGCKRSAHTSRHKPDTPARSGGAQPEPEPNHTHPHNTPQPGVAGYKRSAHTSAHTPQHPSQEWRGAAETRTQPQPRPKNKQHATVGNPVSIARALRQPVPCR